MKFDNLRLFEKHLEGIKGPSYPPLFFIIGKENFDCQQAVHFLLRVLMPTPQMKEYALSVFDAMQMNDNLFWDSLYSPSFLADSKVILIQNADKLKKSTQEKLETYFSKPSPCIHLILIASTWSKQTIFYKTVEKNGVILELGEVKPWEKEKKLVEWVNQQVAAERKIISYQVCQSFVMHVGHDQSLLASELQKLLCYCADRKEIQLQDVKKICTNQQSETIWQLGEALFRRDPIAALQIARSFLLEGQSLLPLLRQIRSQFQTGYQISLLLVHDKGAQEITREFPYMKGQILERNMNQARHYGAASYKKGLIALDATEMQIKNSGIDEEILMELLFFRLCHSPSA